MAATRTFLRDALAWQGAVSQRVLPLVALFGCFAEAVHFLHRYLPWIAVAVTPFEIAGGALAVTLVLRLNAGYERWWEGRKLWGGIVNQCRNVASTTTATSSDRGLVNDVVLLTAAFAHVARRSLRDQRDLPEIEALLGAERARAIAKSDHMPTYVARMLDERLERAARTGRLDRFAFLSILGERMKLIDHLGGCERILKSPLPRVATIKVRRFVLLYLMALPFGVVENPWYVVVFVTAVVAYVTLGFEQVGAELENPFDTEYLSHLPLDEICATIERNLLALGQDSQGEAATSRATSSSPKMSSRLT